MLSTSDELYSLFLEDLLPGIFFKSPYPNKNFSNTTDGVWTKDSVISSLRCVSILQSSEISLYDLYVFAGQERARTFKFNTMSRESDTPVNYHTLQVKENTNLTEEKLKEIFRENFIDVCFCTHSFIRLSLFGLIRFSKIYDHQLDSELKTPHDFSLSTPICNSIEPYCFYYEEMMGGFKKMRGELEEKSSIKRPCPFGGEIEITSTPNFMGINLITKSGQKIPFTSYSFFSNEQTKGFIIINPYQNVLSAIFKEYAEPLYKKIRNRIDQPITMEDLCYFADLMWFLSHTAPCCRGSAAINQRILFALSIERGIWPLEYQKIMLDLDALSTTPEIFREHFVEKFKYKKIEELIPDSVQIHQTEIYQETPLIQAIKENDAHEVIKLLTSGTDIDLSKIEGSISLLLAIKKGNTDIINAIFSYAAEQSKFSILIRLLESDSKIDLTKTNGFAFLLTVIKNENFSAVDLFLEKGANVHLSGDTGFTLLSEAINTGYFDIINLLLEKSSASYLQYENGSQLLSLAAKNKNLDIFLIIFITLLKNGVDIKKLLNPEDLKTLLELQKETTDIVEIFFWNIVHKSRICINPNPIWLHVVKQGEIDLVKIFLQVGIIGLNQKSSTQILPMLRTLSTGTIGLNQGSADIQILLETNNIDIINLVLLRAIEVEDYHIIKTLTVDIVNLNKPDQHGVTPLAIIKEITDEFLVGELLTILTKKNDVDSIRVILESVSELKIYNFTGILEELIKNNADIDIIKLFLAKRSKEQNFYPPINYNFLLEIAKQKDREDVVQLLSRCRSEGSRRTHLMIETIGMDTAKQQETTTTTTITTTLDPILSLSGGFVN